MRPDLLHRLSWQRDIILLRQVDDRLQSHTSVQVPVQVDERKGGIDVRNFGHPGSPRDYAPELQARNGGSRPAIPGSRDAASPRLRRHSNIERGALDPPRLTVMGR